MQEKSGANNVTSAPSTFAAAGLFSAYAESTTRVDHSSIPFLQCLSVNKSKTMPLTATWDLN